MYNEKLMTGAQGRVKVIADLYQPLRTPDSDARSNNMNANHRVTSLPLISTVWSWIVFFM